MNIEKLQKLSCLSIKKDLQEPILKSLEEVMVMMHEIDNLDMPQTQKINYMPSVLRSDEVKPEELIDKTGKTYGLNIEDGFFLAPKVIKK